MKTMDSIKYHSQGAIVVDPENNKYLEEIKRIKAIRRMEIDKMNDLIDRGNYRGRKVILERIFELDKQEEEIKRKQSSMNPVLPGLPKLPKQLGAVPEGIFRIEPFRKTSKIQKFKNRLKNIWNRITQ